jgi:dienelactone hydrolase
MHATVLERPAPAPRRTRPRVTTYLVFAVATGVALLHALDDAFLHRQPGLGLSQHALAALIAAAASIAAIWAFPRMGASLRAATAFTFGVLASVNGAMHVQHIRVDGVARSDLTGVLALAAGLVLAGLAVFILWHRRRWWQRVLAVPVAFVGALFVLGPVALGVIEVHKWREPIGAKPAADYQSVSFRSSDGLKLTGWYRPSSNGAAVLLVHGGNGDRQGPVRHARMLAAQGYGVLLYDSRGRGHSEGSPNGYGWDWRHDVDGAMAFLKGRPDVEPGRIGALGLSTGADVLVEVAPDRDDIQAIVADGTAAESYEDWHRLRGDEAGMVPGWIMFKTMEVLSGDPQSPTLEDRVADIRQPTLMISAGTEEEYEFGVLYDRVGNPNVVHWNLPDATHTAAIRQAAVPYERRVSAFFEQNLR